jgi:hypothetical protein
MVSSRKWKDEQQMAKATREGGEPARSASRRRRGGQQPGGPPVGLAGARLGDFLRFPRRVDRPDHRPARLATCTEVPPGFLEVPRIPFLAREIGKVAAPQAPARRHRAAPLPPPGRPVTTNPVVHPRIGPGKDSGRARGTPRAPTSCRQPGFSLAIPADDPRMPPARNPPRSPPAGEGPCDAPLAWPC